VGTKQLKALLGALRAAGVSSYRDGDLQVTFGDRTQPVHEPDAEGVEDQELPPGVLDPRKRIAELYAKHAKKPGRAS